MGIINEYVAASHYLSTVVHFILVKRTHRPVDTRTPARRRAGNTVKKCWRNQVWQQYDRWCRDDPSSSRYSMSRSYPFLLFQSELQSIVRKVTGTAVQKTCLLRHMVADPTNAMLKPTFTKTVSIIHWKQIGQERNKTWLVTGSSLSATNSRLIGCNHLQTSPTSPPLHTRQAQGAKINNMDNLLWSQCWVVSWWQCELLVTEHSNKIWCLFDSKDGKGNRHRSRSQFSFVAIILLSNPAAS